MKNFCTTGLFLLLALLLVVSEPVPRSASAATIDQTNWTLQYVDSQELVGEDGAATNAFDGNPLTIWHSEWKLKKAPLPHEIQIDLGDVYSIYGFRYLPRQDGGINGTVAQYAFYVSLDGVNWGTPVKQGAFASTLDEKEALFTELPGRYIRFVALKEINSKVFTSVAELNVLGGLYGGNLAPEATVVAPAGDVTVNMGASVIFTGSGLDFDNNLPLLYSWNFGDPTIADASVRDPGPVQFNHVGTYTVTFTVTDSLGLADPTPATRKITVLDGTSTSVIPQTYWKLHYVDSQELVGENGAAINAFDGDPLTIWHTEWKLSQPPLPHEIQIDLGNVYLVHGFRYLPRQDGGINGTMTQYALYASVDGTEWGTPVVQGTFAGDLVEKEALFTEVAARFIRLVALREINGKVFTSVAEINLLGEPAGTNLPPEGTITAPASNVTINMGEMVNFSGTGSDQDNTLPLSYLWHFGDPGLADSTLPSPGPVQFNSPGVFTVTLIVTDALGLADASPATITVKVENTSNNLPPDGQITAPAGSVTINRGESVAFTGTGTDPENYSLSYAWDFADPAIPDIKEKDPGPVQFNTAGTYVVVFTVTDASGFSDPTPAVRYITVLDAAADSVIPQSGWSLLYADSQEVTAEDGAATNAFDGDPLTIWHTRYYGSAPYPPHDLRINLSAQYDINGFRYLPRQQGLINGRIFQYEFYVSRDGSNWGSPVAQGAFVNSPEEKEIRFPVVTGRYVRLVALREVNDRPFTTVAELNVLGGFFSGNHAPESAITLPTANVTISPGASVNFSGSGSDPENNQPLTYLWNFGDPAIPSARVKDPGLVRFNTAGTYVVSFTAVDALGRADATPATCVVNVEANSADNLIPQINMSLHYVDSEELVAEDGRATNAFDGDTATIWHTQWKDAAPPPPHEIQINLGSAYEMYELDYLPRQIGLNGTITKYEIYVSPDGLDWGAPVATGALAADNSLKRIVFAPKLGQFIALVALNSVNNKPWTSAAEINVKGRCETPYVKILHPADYTLSPSTDLTLVVSVCLNDSTHSGWGVKFTLDGGRTYISRAMPYSVAYQNVAFTEHTVEAVIVDNNGAEVTGPLTRDQVIHVGVGDYYVALGDSITAGAFDDLLFDNVSTDGRNVEGGFTPILNNLLTGSKGYPQTVVSEGIPGFTSADGLARLPVTLSHHPDSRNFLIMYGTNDAAGLLPVAPSTFKANLQKMIDMIQAAGKNAYLAKVPYSLDLGRNSVIQSYNVVIDQLVTENSIPVVPPDFYGYFAMHQNEFSDSLHPNGRGYQSMASLWHAALP